MIISSNQSKGENDGAWESFIRSFSPQSRPGWERLISEFFVPDEIEPIVFITNRRSLLHEAVASFDCEGQDMRQFLSPSIAALCDPQDRPSEYHRWFIAAYPDVVTWVSNLDEGEKQDAFVGIAMQRGYDQENKFTLEALRALVDLYKTSSGKRLESSS